MSRGFRKKKREKKKCDSRFDFIAFPSDSVASSSWNVARLKIITERHIDAEIREGRAEKNGRKSVSVRARRNYIRVTRFCLVESRGYNTRSVQHSASFRCWSNSTRRCFLFFFLLQRRRTCPYLPFSFRRLCDWINKHRKKENLETSLDF